MGRINLLGKLLSKCQGRDQKTCSFFSRLRERLPRFGKAKKKRNRHRSRSPIAVGHLANISPFFFLELCEFDFFVLFCFGSFSFLFHCRTAAKRDSAEFRCFFAIERNLIDCTNYNNLVFLLNVFLHIIHQIFFRSHHPPFLYVRVLGGLCQHTGRGMETLWAKELPAERQTMFKVSWTNSSNVTRQGRSLELVPAFVSVSVCNRDTGHQNSPTEINWLWICNGRFTYIRSSYYRVIRDVHCAIQFDTDRLVLWWHLL